MTISYTTGIPAANNNPSTDQPNMKTNNDNIKAIIAVDHATFDASNSGTHNHVTFTSTQTDPSLSASQTQIYPKTFGTGTTFLENYLAFRASSGSQVVGYAPGVKCMGRFTTVSAGFPATLYTSAAPTATEQNTLFVNVTTIVQSTVGDAGNTITITFANALPHTNYFVFFEVGVSSAATPTIAQVTKGTANLVFTKSSFSAAGLVVGFMVI